MIHSIGVSKYAAHKISMWLTDLAIHQKFAAKERISIKEDVVVLQERENSMMYSLICKKLAAQENRLWVFHPSLIFQTEVKLAAIRIGLWRLTELESAAKETEYTQTPEPVKKNAVVRQLIMVNAANRQILKTWDATNDLQVNS
jgi:hypothetical protein